MQRDAKMVSYKVVDKSAKPYVEVDVAGEKKVFSQAPDASAAKQHQNHCLMPATRRCRVIVHPPYILLTESMPDI